MLFNMTMVPSQNNKNYAFFYTAMNQVEGYNSNYSNCLLGSDFLLRNHMAEDLSRATTNNHNHEEQEEEEEATSKGEREQEQEHEHEEEEQSGINNNNSSNWLQLSIGFHDHDAAATTKQDHHHHHHLEEEAGSTMAAATTGSAGSSSSSLVELELLPGRHFNWASSSSSSRTVMFPFSSSSSSLFYEQQHQTSMSLSMSMSMACGPNMSAPTTTFATHHQQQDMMLMNWASSFSSHPLMPPFLSSSSSLSSLSQSCSSSSLRPSYFPTTPPFHHQFDVAGPSSSQDFTSSTVRVVDPPRRPHSGIWFMLQAEQNQVREPFLPQIAKSYLRIKDGRMTVRLLMKYLVSKLRLQMESEIEITCRGQKLLPFLTLQHVRDNIWTQRDTTNITTTSRPLLSDSSTTDHVMVLHYSRTNA
ncbi:uncharacterized protein DDB_G0271670 [Arachis ipaensis]|uniref:Uncharacterized protein n=1 Tax=Arachis hypogaea TaxID=3818 RepID=A0A444WP87_ARAHY|nr:uncharacterized protein DDB_G0271670 [Arachis ipaensis]XP_025648427.2 protein LAX PANICLE 2-like [Arachis hypogaea]XP_025693170.2 protein LAX PANICLE 2-like [Arachis hypogaea]QHO09598.1 E3 ubiquitin protein ligase [Arachis hypogaea]RYQ79048.1 hypothetical protein Ahy_Scaffold8g108535 [Arachis hypogaea]